MVTEERRQQVRRILEELPSNDRKLLRMIFYEGIDRAEICKQLHVEREYLRVLVHRAKARFRECLLKQRAAGDQAHAAPPWTPVSSLQRLWAWGRDGRGCTLSNAIVISCPIRPRPDR